MSCFVIPLEEKVSFRHVSIIRHACHFNHVEIQKCCHLIQWDFSVVCFKQDHNLDFLCVCACVCSCTCRHTCMYLCGGARITLAIIPQPQSTLGFLVLVCTQFLGLARQALHKLNYHPGPKAYIFQQPLEFSVHCRALSLVLGWLVRHLFSTEAGVERAQSSSLITR